MWTRRQFGRWAGAALLLGPTASGATPPQAQATEQAPVREAEPATAGLEELDFSASLDAVSELNPDGETPDVVLQLHVANRGKRGQSVSVSLVNAVIVADGETESVHAWLNDQHPFSRRIEMPSFVDLAPSSEPKLVAAVKVRSNGETAKKGAVLKLRVRVFDVMGGSREVELPPISLSGDKAES